MDEHLTGMRNEHTGVKVAGRVTKCSIGIKALPVKKP